MLELFANRASTSLASSINASVTTLTVGSSAKFPAGSGIFRILVDGEYMVVTGVSGTTWTVTRGAESTAAVSHNAGAVVKQVVTAATYTGFAQTVGVPATLFSSVTTTQSSGTAETNMFSQTIPANSLGTTGDALSADYGLILAVGVSTRRIRLYYAGTLVFDSGIFSINAAGSAALHVRIIRDSSSSVRVVTSCAIGGLLQTGATGLMVTTTPTPVVSQVAVVTGMDHTVGNLLTLTGTCGAGAATGDVTASLAHVSLIPLV